MDMNEQQFFTKLAEVVGKMAVQQPAVPLSVALWDTNDIASYLKRSKDRVYSDIVCLPSFPRPIRLPVKGRAHALYKAREVISWAEKHTS